MEKLLLISFLLLPFGFLSFGLIHAGQQYAFILSGLIACAVMQKNIWIKAFFLYLTAWCLAVFILNLVLHIDPKLLDRMMSTIVFFMAGGMLFLAIRNCKIKNDLFYDVICIAAIIQGIISGLQMLGFDPVFELLNRTITAQKLLDKNMIIGSLGNPNFLTAFMAFSLVFFLRGKWIFAAIIPVFFLIAGKTTGSFVAAAMGISIYYRKPIYGIIISAAYMLWDSPYRQTVLGITGSPSDGGSVTVITPQGSVLEDEKRDMGRVFYWKTAITQLLANPLYVIFGFGPGTGPFRYPLHNEWLESWYQYGVIGFGLLSGYVLTIYRKNKILFTAFIIICLNMAVNYPLHLGPSAFLIIIIAALIERERLQNG